MSDFADPHFEGDATYLAVEDAETVISLVSRVCDPGSPLSIQERRSELCRTLATLVDGDAWFGSVGVSSPDDPIDSPNFTSYDGGWQSEEERLEVYRVFVDRNVNELVNQHTIKAFDLGQVFTFRRHDVISEEVWQASPSSALWNGLGLDHFMITIYPMPDRYYSAIGIYRHLGRPAFTVRQRTLLHLVWQQVEWLHRRDIKFPVGHQVVELSVRERQVVMLLLAGHSAKYAAEKLGISVHTVGGYVKSIYRKLKVNSRPELVSKFLPLQASD